MNIFDPFSRQEREVLTMTVRGGQLRLLSARGRRVTWFRVVPLNPAFLEGGIIARPEGVAASVAAALEQGKRQGVKHCIAALPGFHSPCEVIDLPQSREVRPEEVLPREARRLFSYRPQSSTLSWWRVPGKGTGRRYAMIITRQAALHAMQEVARLAGLRLMAVDSGLLALARAANTSDGVVVQAESDGCEVVVLKGGGLGLLRSAFWGAEVMDSATLTVRVLDLVERNVAIHNESSQAGPLSSDAPIYLAGAAAEALGPQLAEALGRPLGSWASPINLPRDLPMADLAVNIGLALREVRR